MITTVLLSLALTAEPAPAEAEKAPSPPPEAAQPAPEPAQPAPAAEAPAMVAPAAPAEKVATKEPEFEEGAFVKSLKIREFRGGIGTAHVSDGHGGSVVTHVGVQFSPWEHFAFRVPLGFTYGGDFGQMNQVSISPGVVYRFTAPGSFITPYAGIGLDVSLLNIDEDATRNYNEVSHPNALWNNDGGRDSNSWMPGGHSRFSAAPDANIGVAVRIMENTSIELNARYLLLNYESEVRHAFNETLNVCMGF
jgi:hypothetical protein